MSSLSASQNDRCKVSGLHVLFAFMQSRSMQLLVRGHPPEVWWLLGECEAFVVLSRLEGHGQGKTNKTMHAVSEVHSVKVQSEGPFHLTQLSATALDTKQVCFLLTLRFSASFRSDTLSKHGVVQEDVHRPSGRQHLHGVDLDAGERLFSRREGGGRARQCCIDK